MDSFMLLRVLQIQSCQKMSASILKKTLAVSTASISAALLYKFESDEGIRRAVKMYSSFGPIVLSYRAIELKHAISKPLTEAEADGDWDTLHQMYAEKVLRTIQELKGFYVKYGQVLAGRPDILPDIYIEKLRTLEDAVPPIPFDEVEKIITSSLGIDSTAEVFAEISRDPVGSASIGQVHKARLKNSGQVVAVKVKYPNVERLFRNDIRTARGFCKIFAPEQLIMFDEIERQFMTEFDYQKEAEQMNVIRANMKRFKRLIEVPQPILNMTTKDVLVMSFLEGKKLYDSVREIGEKYAAQQGKTFKDLEREMRLRLKNEGMPPKYSGPSAFQIEMYRSYGRIKSRISNFMRMSVNVPLHFTFPSKKLPYIEEDIPPNIAIIMDTLMRVYGHQILVDGYFNADPHAGNILLLEDGRLGLIDYGQVKSLTYKERRHLCEVIIALARKDKRRLKQLAVIGGYKSRHMDENVIYNMTRFALDTDGPEVCGSKNIQQFMDEQYQLDPWSSTDPSIVMPVRTAFMLRGVGLILSHPVSVVDYWAPIAFREFSLDFPQSAHPHLQECPPA